MVEFNKRVIDYVDVAKKQASGVPPLKKTPNPEDIAAKIVEYFQLGENYFLPQLREEKKKYSWSNMVEAIVNL